MKISLRPFSNDDIPKVIDWIESPRTLLFWSGTTFDYPLDTAQMTAHRQRLADSSGRRRAYIGLRSDGTAVGYGEMFGLGQRSDSVQIVRLLVGPAALRRSGYGRALLQAFISLAFGDRRILQVRLTVVEGNVAALRLYESYGFRCVEEKTSTSPGEPSLRIMSLLAEHYTPQ